MIHRFIKIYIFLTVLLGDFILFAQDPGNDFEDEEGNTDGTIEDDPYTPINTKLIWLAVVGIAFGYYTFKQIQRNAINSNPTSKL